jgi:hypothetical protein
VPKVGRLTDSASEKLHYGFALKSRPDIRPITPLRRLLSQYQNICERILDEQEIEVGLWAYKRRSRSQRRLASF